MKYIIKYSPLSINDLKRVYNEVYQASLNDSIAKKYVNDLMDKIEDKKGFLESGIPLTFNNVFTGYRYVVFKQYVVFYYIEENIIYIDRILFAKSDYIKKLHLLSK